MASFTVVIKPVPDKLSSVEVLAHIVKYLPAKCTPNPNSSGERFNKAFINFPSLNDASIATAALDGKIVWIGPLIAVLQNTAPVKQPSTAQSPEKSQHETLPTAMEKHHSSNAICHYGSQCTNVRCERDRKYLSLLLMYYMSTPVGCHIIKISN